MTNYVFCGSILLLKLGGLRFKQYIQNSDSSLAWQEKFFAVIQPLYKESVVLFKKELYHNFLLRYRKTALFQGGIACASTVIPTHNSLSLRVMKNIFYLLVGYLKSAAERRQQKTVLAEELELPPLLA